MLEPDPAPGNIWVLVLVLIGSFLIHGFLAAAQAAVLSRSESGTRKDAEKGDRRAARLLALTKDASRFTLRVQTAKTVFLMLFSGGAAFWLAPAVAGWLTALLPHTAAFWLAVVAIMAVAAWLLLAFEEVAPRRIASQKPDRLAYRFAGGLALFTGLFAPLAGMIELCARVPVRLFGLDPRLEAEAVTEEEILQMVDEGEEKGVIEESQKEMINKVFEFDDITAEEIMTPRTDVTALEIGRPVEEALQVSTEEGYSRIPLYTEDIDHIEGVLYVKDLLPFVGKSLPANATLRGFMRETYFVPGTKRCGELFAEMTEKRVQMAVVVDEYGGVAGIVTMEDLVESIVGNIQDEFDNEEEELTQTGENSFEADGAMSMEELCERWEIPPPEGDYDTVAGFILDALGCIPEEDEHPTVTYENLTLTVVRMDDRRIERVHIAVDLPETEEEEKP